MAGIRLRIGAKLAAAAAIGILFTAALIVANRSTTAQVDRLARQVAANIELVSAVDAANVTLRDMRVIYRDARLAADPAIIDEQIATLDKLATVLREQISGALAKVASEENRQRLQTILAQAEPYAAANREVMTLQHEVVTLAQRAADAAAEWDQKMLMFRSALSASTDPNTGEILVLGEQSDNMTKAARVATWQYLVTGDAKLKSRVEDSLVAANNILATVAQTTTENAIAARAKELATKLPEIRNIIGSLQTARTAQDAAISERATPLANAISTALTEAHVVADRYGKAMARDVETAIVRAEWLGLLLGGIVIAVLIASAVYGMFVIARPIGRVAHVLKELVAGDTAIVVPYIRRADEVGDAARAADAFKDNLILTAKLAAEQKSVETRAAAERAAALHELANAFEHEVGGIVQAVASAAEQLQRSAQAMVRAAEQTSQQSVVVARAGETASGNVSTVASAAEELLHSVEEISQRVAESARIATAAENNADDTGRKVSRLSAAAQKIGDVIGLISTIAAQTNLLALNATIEAARAGEAGRGFAVVASEVKSLADQTTRATAEIAKQVEEIQGSTAASADAIDAITETIRRMSEISTAVASAIEEQGGATREIARNVQHAAASTKEVSDNIVSVRQVASDSSAASAQVLSSAVALGQQAEQLSQKVQTFLESVRGRTRAA